MDFNINASYEIVGDACGNVYFYQSSLYYLPYSPYAQTTKSSCTPHPEPNSTRLYSIGEAGEFPNLGAAIVAAGERWRTSNQMTGYGAGQNLVPKTSFVATFTQGSADFVYVSGQTFTGTSGLVGQEFVKIGDDYYRVKTTSSTTAGKLFGPFKGTTNNYTCTPLVLDWCTLELEPGAHASYADVSVMQPGMILAGSSKESTTLVESNSGAAFLMQPMTKVVNVTLEPNILYGSFDRLTYVDPINSPGGGYHTYPYGCEVRIDKCKVVCGNERGPHAGGNISWPVVTGGQFVVTNSEVEFMNNVGGVAAGGESGVFTRLLFDSVTWAWKKGYGNPTYMKLIYDSFVAMTGPVTIDVSNCNTQIDDAEFNPIIGPLGAYDIGDANTTFNLTGGVHRITNNNSSASATEFPAMVVCSGGVVNVQGGAVIEATGSTTSGANQGTGIYNNGGTVNVRAGCRVRGDTNKAINNVSGTVNVSPNADVINGTTGIITALAT